MNRYGKYNCYRCIWLGITYPQSAGLAFKLDKICIKKGPLLKNRPLVKNHISYQILIKLVENNHSFRQSFSQVSSWIFECGPFFDSDFTMNSCRSRGCKSIRGQSLRWKKLPYVSQAKRFYVVKNLPWMCQPISFKLSTLTLNNFADPLAARMHSFSFESLEQFWT